MQIVLIGLGLVIALVPVASIKRISTGDTRRIRSVRRALFVIAILFGCAAADCWLLTQSDVEITSQRGPSLITLLFGFSLAFLAALAGSAFLGHQKHGLRAVLCSTCFLFGIGGLSVFVLFVITWRGFSFRLGALPCIVLVVSATCVALFWRTVPSSTNTRY